MAQTQRRTNPARATGHVSHDAQVRVDERVARILARRASPRPAARTAEPRPTDAAGLATRRER
jgi:3-phenylpropionate/cinnamic acid dioxygenase small subunit